ncbi:MAG TPA: hypothetical protein VIK24_04000 [Pyrinomonadaceae bacterium]
MSKFTIPPTAVGGYFKPGLQGDLSFNLTPCAETVCGDNVQGPSV